MTVSVKGTMLSLAISGSCCSGCRSLCATSRGEVVSAGRQNRPAQAATAEHETAAVTLPPDVLYG